MTPPPLDTGAGGPGEGGGEERPPEERRGLIEGLVRLAVFNPVFVNLLFWIIVGAGIAAAFLLPREQFPEVSLDRVAITTVYPGATAQDVEELITREVEEALENVSDVDRVVSVSTEGSSSVVVTFLSGKDLQDGRAEVEKAMAGGQPSKLARGDGRGGGGTTTCIPRSRAPGASSTCTRSSTARRWSRTSRCSACRRIRRMATSRM